MKMENKKYLLSTFKRAVYFQKKRAGLIFYLIASHYEMVAKEKKHKTTVNNWNTQHKHSKSPY